MEVVLERRRRLWDERRFRILVAYLTVLMAINTWMLLRLVRVVDDPAFVLKFVAVMLLLISPGLVLVAMTVRRAVLERSVVVDEDRVRVMGPKGVLAEVVFDERARVRVLPGVEGYVFTRGWFMGIQVSTRFYDVEDLERALPVVMAAVREHGMRAGENLERLMSGTSS